MIYIQDNIGRFVKREKNEMYTKMECTNQLTQSTFTINIPIKQPNGKFYQDIRVVVPNGSYDYSLYIGDKLAYTGIFTNIIEVEKKEVNNAYNVEYNTITYTPNQKPIEIPERVLEITKNGEYDVTNFNKANVLVVEGTDCEDIVKQLQEEITDLENDKADLEDAINTLENEVQDLEGEIADKEADIIDLQDQINTIGKYTITSNGTYAPEAGILGWNEVVVNVPSEGTNCDDIITDLTNQINALEAEKQALLVQLDKALNNIEKLEAQIVELNTEITQLNTEIEGLLLEKQQLENTVTDLQEKVNSVTTITINEEGTYVAPEGVLGYNEIIVDIQEPEEPFVPEYLKFESNGVGYVLYVTDGTLSPNLEISRDGVNFTPYGILGGSYSIEGNKPLYIRGVNNTQISDINNHFAFSIPNSNHRIYVSGNIMSLVDGEGRTKVIPDDNMFSYLFANEEQGEDIYFGDLTLPATTLTKGCYKGMFLNTKTSSVPSILPATTLQDECYESMFEGTNIFNSPYIMAEYLQKDCLKHTFRRAGKLEHAFIFAKNLYNADYYWGDGEELHIDMDNCAYECFLLAGSTLIDDCNCDHKTPRTYLLCSEQMECEWNTYDYYKNMGIFITSLPQSLINNIIQ